VIFQAENRARILCVTFHCVYYASGAKLIQGSNWGGGTAGTASLFRCQLKQAVPEA
jgi:hypothetical protein